MRSIATFSAGEGTERTRERVADYITKRKTASKRSWLLYLFKGRTLPLPRAPSRRRLTVGRSSFPFCWVVDKIDSIAQKAFPTVNNTNFKLLLLGGQRTVCFVSTPQQGLNVFLAVEQYNSLLYIVLAVPTYYLHYYSTKYPRWWFCVIVSLTIGDFLWYSHIPYTVTSPVDSVFCQPIPMKAQLSYYSEWKIGCCISQNRVLVSRILPKPSPSNGN